MREPPDLPHDAVIASVRAGYNIPAASLEFLPLGHDSSAWVYRARGEDGVVYFLKVPEGAVHEPGLVVPRYLRDRGLDHAVAPLPTVAGALWAALGGFALILYP